MKIFLIVLGILLATLLLLALITCYVTYAMAFRQSGKNKYVDPYKMINKSKLKQYIGVTTELVENVMKIPYEDIYTTSHDGKKLHAKLYMVKDGAPFALQFHGYRSTSVCDFSGGGILAMRLGMNVIMVDQRAHGESDGTIISFGAKEKYDVVTWANYILENFGRDTKIMLHGVSMGAGTIILASALEELPENVLGVIADCPFSSCRDIVSKTIREMRLSDKLFYPFLRFGAMLFGGFDPNEAEPRAAAKNAKIPILLIHGEADDFVPCDMSREIKAAGGDMVTLHTFPDATHAMSYVLDTARYEGEAEKFILSLIPELRQSDSAT